MERIRPGWRVVTVAAFVLLLTTLLEAGCADAPQPGATSGSRPTLPSTPTALPEYTPAEFRALLASLRGTPVVMNIWASWCGPCTAEAPGLARVARAFRGKAQFLGVDIIDHVPPARAFIRKYGWSYPSVFDPEGAIRDDFGFIGQPVTVVFDRAGNVALTHSGPIPEDILRTAVEDALSA